MVSVNGWAWWVEDLSTLSCAPLLSTCPLFTEMFGINMDGTIVLEVTDDHDDVLRDIDVVLHGSRSFVDKL